MRLEVSEARLHLSPGLSCGLLAALSVLVWATALALLDAASARLWLWPCLPLLFFTALRAWRALELQSRTRLDLFAGQSRSCVQGGAWQASEVETAYLSAWLVVLRWRDSQQRGGYWLLPRDCLGNEDWRRLQLRLRFPPAI